MKRIFFLPIVLLAIFTSSCSHDNIDGSGNLTSEIRNVTHFTKVSSEGVFEMTVTQGESQSVEVIADDNIIPKVITKVVNNELRFYLDEDNNYKNISLQANITVPVINGLINSGTGNVLMLNVNSDTDFNVYNSGTGDISIEGSAQGLNLKNEGSGIFEGFQFMVDTCDIKIEGSGDVHYLGTPTIEAN